MKGLIFGTLLTCSMNIFSQTMDWVSLPQEVNDFVFTMCEYDGKLIAVPQGYIEDTKEDQNTQKYKKMFKQRYLKYISFHN